MSELLNGTGTEDQQDPAPEETQVQTAPQAEEPAYQTEKPAAAPEPAAKPKKKKKKPLKVSLFMAIIAALFAALLAAQITFIAVKRNFDAKLAAIQVSGYSNQKLDRLDYIYRTYYINGIDNNKLTDGLMEGYIYGTGDKYGNYMTAEEYADYRSKLNSKLVGIGVTVIWDSEHQAIEVMTVYEDSPAEKAGIRIGDLIIAADGQKASELGLDRTVEVIKGEEGTTVEITVLTGDGNTEEKTLTVGRSAINIKTVKYYAKDNIGVVTISDFYTDTPKELKAAVTALQAQGCDRLIFDMRNNPGGLLEAVVSALDYLLPEGVVVRTVTANGEEESYRSDAECVNMPMVVIVNGNTASAAELFTSALMDYKYATVVGTKTYGKGTVTAPYQLGDGSIVYVSSMLYYPPVSDNFEGKGITPDVECELSDEVKGINLLKLTYEQDNQLQKAVEIIKNK